MLFNSGSKVQCMPCCILGWKGCCYSLNTAATNLGQQHDWLIDVLMHIAIGVNTGATENVTVRDGTQEK